MAIWTDQRRVFVDEYLKCWNATEAARRAKYKHPNKYGPYLVKLGIIQNEIKKRLRANAMDADEVLSRLSDQGRGNMADFINPFNPQGVIDLQKADEKGLLHLVKSISWTKQGIRIELYDAQAALVHIGRHLQLFTDKVKVEDWRSEVVALLREGKVTPQQVKDELGDQLAKELFESIGLDVITG